jgi:membrane-bound serine protease (ClpP class)
MTEEEFEKLSKERPGDPAVKLKKTWCKKGQLLTLSSDEAVLCGLSRGKAGTAEEVCAGLGIASPKITVAEMTWAENVNRYLSHPAVSLLLVIIAVIGVVFELKSPGAGLGFRAALLAMGVFFWIQVVMDRAGAFSIILFLVGMVLLAVEIFAIPGHGALGAIGFGMIVVSLILSFLPASVNLWDFLVGRDTPWWQREALYRGLSYGFASVLAAIFGAMFLLVYGARLPGLSRLVQKGEVTANVDAAPGRESLAELVGMTGVADSILRPSGRAVINGRTVDVVSQSEYIEAGEKIKVVRVKDGIVVVDRA